jgi:hypothetical protein
LKYSDLIFRTKLFSKFIGKTLAGSKSFRTFAVNKSSKGSRTLKLHTYSLPRIVVILLFMLDLFTHFAGHFFYKSNQINQNEQIKQPREQRKEDSEKGA